MHGRLDETLGLAVGLGRVALGADTCLAPKRLHATTKARDGGVPLSVIARRTVAPRCLQRSAEALRCDMALGCPENPGWEGWHYHAARLAHNLRVETA